MSEKYRINPNFVVPEPTAARHFFYCSEADYRAGKDWREVLDGWRDAGVKQMRLTLVNDEYPNDPYPHGVWFEGWTDESARQLPFGEAEKPEGQVWPPLTFDPPNAPRNPVDEE